MMRMVWSCNSVATPRDRCGAREPERDLVCLAIHREPGTRAAERDTACTMASLLRRAGARFRLAVQVHLVLGDGGTRDVAATAAFSTV